MRASTARHSVTRLLQLRPKRKHCRTSIKQAAEHGFGARSNGAHKEETAYVTTPIYYVNDEPHIGHLYTSTLADAIARYQRLRGKRVMFLTGTDEHGGKVEQSAHQNNRSPQEHADANAARFVAAADQLGISYDEFIRTSEDRHVRQVQAAMHMLHQNGDLYLGQFEGWYDAGQEEYYTELRAHELDYTSPVNGKPLIRAQESNYYFRLSQYQDAVENALTAAGAAQPQVVPQARLNEILERVRAGLADVPVTRTQLSWGVQVPFDPEHVVYVWIDALLNYVTALGMLDERSGNVQKLHAFWPATVHVMAKEITWFHAVIWPALLIALGFDLPHVVYSHSFWVREGRKMSKSLGNFVDLKLLQTYVDAYGLDAMRYYMLTQGPAGTSDANFSSELIHRTYSDHLVNALGNCASRTTAMINKYFKEDGVPPDALGDDTLICDYDIRAAAEKARENALKHYEELDTQAAANAAIQIVELVDVFINDSEPFRLAKDPSRMNEVSSILYRSLEAVRVASSLLLPIMPTKAAELLSNTMQLHGPEEVYEHTMDDLSQWGLLTPGAHVPKLAPFPRKDERVE